MSEDHGASVELTDDGGNHVCSLHLFKSDEDAGQHARDYWEEYVRDDRDAAIELLGAENLLSWALGEYAGPGPAKVSSLEEWFDLYLENPHEHFESGPFDIELIGENIIEAIGFKPTVAYSME